MLIVPVVVFVHCSWRFNSGANGEGEILPSTDALLSGNYNAGNDAEPDLRNDEPKPVDPLVEHGINGFENAMQQARS